LDLSASFLIGDSTTDLLAGQAAGIGQLVLVRTGRGAAQEAELDSSGLADYAVFDNLPQAVAQLPLNLS
jgi:histidinol phosphatase-like enzyme